MSAPKRPPYDPFKKALVEAEAAKNAVPPTPPPSGVDLKDLLDKSGIILFREIENLMFESKLGLLSKDSSAMLVNYIKVLKELHKEEKATLEAMSDTELEKLLE